MNPDRTAVAGRARCTLAAGLAALLLLGAGCAAPPASNVLPRPLRDAAPSAAVAQPATRPMLEPSAGRTEQAGRWAERSMVVAAHPFAAQAGRAILAEGGSAVDAAVAVQAVLTLVEPQSSGIGGGLFLVHHDGRSVQTWDGRETAPAAATPDLFVRDGRPLPFLEAVVGGRSVGTPGALRALELAHAAHGRLAWARLFEPAIRLADEGFPISARLHATIRDHGGESLRADPDAAAYFFDAVGAPKAIGTRLRNPALAQVLRDVAARGSVAFYEGPVARDIVAKVRGHAANPGSLSLADLAGYRARERAPLCFDHRAWRVCGMGPPSSGALAIGQMLGLLAAPGVPDIRAQSPRRGPAGLEPTPQAVHLFSEAGRLAYADRDRYVADTDFVPLPGGDAAALLAPAYLARRAALIGERSAGRALPGAPLTGMAAQADDRSPELLSTSHVAIVDGEGHALSMTTTIEYIFGARLMVRGFLLNNQLTDFSFVPDECPQAAAAQRPPANRANEARGGPSIPCEGGVPVANRVEPGKRPRSSMAPLLVFDRAAGGPPVLVLGSPGGASIINYVAKALVATLDWGLDAQQALALPNFGSRNGPTELEAGRVSTDLVRALEARGHALQQVPMTSGLQAIQRRVHDGRPAWFGATDPRGEGEAAAD